MIPINNIIITFNEFSLNELQTKTYHDAASKLRKIGHPKRADELTNWSSIVKGRHLGLFNVNLSIMELERLDARKNSNVIYRVLVPSTISSGPTRKQGIIVEPSPIPCYISGGWIGDVKEMYDGEVEDCTQIDLNICAVSPEITDTVGLFTISVGIKWENGTFHIVENSVNINGNGAINDWDEKILFSDRTSARKFKSKFLEKENFKKMVNIDESREFFMEYSTAEDWDKYLREVNSISVNLLYT